MKIRITLHAIALFLALASPLLAQEKFSTVRIIPGVKADEVEKRYVQLLTSRIQGISSAPVITVGSGGEPSAGLTIHIGTAESNPALAAAAQFFEVRLPAKYDPGKEGFVLASRKTSSGMIVIAAGADRRGVLYAVGEILRRAVGRGDAVEFPPDLNLRCAPRWPMRGLSVSQGTTIRELTHSRAWTQQEFERAHLDYALAGANTFEIGASGDAARRHFDFLKSYGLDTLTVIAANVGSGPPEWQAKEAIGRPGYLSPGVPAARAALIERSEGLFKAMPDIDTVHFKSGDGGGDESEASAPYGGTLIRLCEDYTKILHKYHPNTKVFVGNQKLDNAGEKAIFDYLRAEKRDWISGIVYGPGSNAMGWTPGRRQDHRMDLFEYGGRGAVGGYLREMLHQLPAQQSILLFTDLTHWVYSEYGLMDHELIPDRNHELPPKWDRWMYDRKPDEAMKMVYDRRTFHARPQNYYRVFQETAQYTIGDVAYSEGHHDHANQWMYQRLFWNPHQSVEGLVGEYARTHFGPEAAPAMTEAIFTLEQNLQTPIATNAGIDRMIDLTRRAGEVIPADLKARSYLWRQYMQKADLDKYIQLDVRRQRKFYDKQIAGLTGALEKGTAKATTAALEKNELPEPSVEMKRLKEEAGKLGDESEKIFGVRSEGYFNLKQDYHGFGWLKGGIALAAKAESEAASSQIIRRIVKYEDPGEGGFYDDAGEPGKAPHLVYGWPFGESGVSSANRRSQRTMAFSTDEPRGVTFEYKNLDRSAQYRVRLTLVRPKYLPRFGMFQHQTSESIYADDIPLAENLEVPEYVAGFFEFDIPKSATADGELVLWFKKQKGIGEGLASDVTIWRDTGGWGTVVSEVWLMKKGSSQ